MSLIYLAVPYSHSDFNVSIDRFNRVNTIAARLMAEGKHVYSPISHTHPIALAGNLPKDWAYWEEYLNVIMPKCAELYVLTLDGWDSSTGVLAEIALAKTLNIPVTFISYPENL